jgi:hypothetical protein
MLMAPASTRPMDAVREPANLGSAIGYYRVMVGSG